MQYYTSSSLSATSLLTADEEARISYKMLRGGALNGAASGDRSSLKWDPQMTSYDVSTSNLPKLAVAAGPVRGAASGVDEWRCW